MNNPDFYVCNTCLTFKYLGGKSNTPVPCRLCGRPMEFVNNVPFYLSKEKKPMNYNNKTAETHYEAFQKIRAEADEWYPSASDSQKLELCLVRGKEQGIDVDAAMRTEALKLSTAPRRCPECGHLIQ